MEEKKRRGYKTQEQQYEATKRYLDNNPEAKEKKKISNIKSNGKTFILKYSTLQDLAEYEEFIKERKNILKNKKSLDIVK